MKHIFIVENEQGMRIDKFLQEMMPNLSRSRVQALIKDQHILCNHLPCKSNLKLKLQDKIEVEIPQDEPLEIIPKPMPLDIVYEDEDVIVVNKAKGVVVHPAPGHYEDTLVHGLLYHCQDLSGINGILRPGIVHRIDKDTTGLLIVAKNDKAHQELVKQLQNKEVRREYYALVHGHIAHEYGTIDAPIGRDPKDRQKMCVTSENSKEAKTHFQVVERWNDFTLVRCKLETGRTHQIRVHMQYINHPVVGDPKYGFKKPFVKDGQLLHAFELSFIHPTTKKEICVQAKIPEAFEAILEELRNR